MKAIVLSIIILPILLAGIAIYSSEEIGNRISEYITLKSVDQEGQNTGKRKNLSSKKVSLSQSHSPKFILSQAKKTWDKINRENSSIEDLNNSRNPFRFQLFSYDGQETEGQFVKKGLNWIECDPNGKYMFTFREFKRDETWIYLNDDSRDYSAKLPLKLAFMFLRTDEIFYRYKPVLPIWE